MIIAAVIRLPARYYISAYVRKHNKVFLTISNFHRRNCDILCASNITLLHSFIANDLNSICIN